MFSRLRNAARRTPATKSNNNRPQFNKANLNALNGQVRTLVSSIRKLKKTIPSNVQTTNAFVNSTVTERAAMNRAIVNFIKKYNKAIDQTAAAAAVVQQAPYVVPSKPLPTPPAAVQQARQATQQAQQAAQRVQQQVARATPKNRITNLKNTNLSNNVKVNAAIKRIRGMNPNVNWATVNTNGLTNAQKKVLNGLRDPLYVGLKRQSTPRFNVQEGNMSMFNQKQAVLPQLNANLQFLMSIGNRKPTNAEYNRVLNIEQRTTNPVTKKKAQNILNANVYSRL